MLIENFEIAVNGLLLLLVVSVVYLPGLTAGYLGT